MRVSFKGEELNVEEVKNLVSRSPEVLTSEIKKDKKKRLIRAQTYDKHWLAYFTLNYPFQPTLHWTILLIIKSLKISFTQSINQTISLSTYTINQRNRESLFGVKICNFLWKTGFKKQLGKIRSGCGWHWFNSPFEFFKFLFGINE